MKIANILTVAGFVILATSWILWFVLGAYADPFTQFWVSFPIQVTALLTFSASMCLRYYQGRQNRPPEGNGEPRSG